MAAQHCLSAGGDGIAAVGTPGGSQRLEGNKQCMCDGGGGSYNWGRKGVGGLFKNHWPVLSCCPPFPYTFFVWDSLIITVSPLNCELHESETLSIFVHPQN